MNSRLRKMRIVFGSNDGENIVPDHMGTAEHFYIFDLFEDGSSLLVEKRGNTSPEEEEGVHGDVKKLAVAINIFEDCGVVLGRRGSPNFVRMRDNTGFQPVVTRVASFDGAMSGLARSFDEIFALVERRKRGERPSDIPIVGRGG